ncbi:MAG: hypothetical protein ACLUN9_27760 [Enterocloster aldenensis]
MAHGIRNRERPIVRVLLFRTLLLRSTAMNKPIMIWNAVAKKEYISVFDSILTKFLEENTVI